MNPGAAVPQRRVELDTDHYDETNRSLLTVDYAHHEIHEGDHYFVSGFVDLAINNVFDLQFTTPDSAKWSHFRFVLSSENETDWYIYEGASVGTAGTSVAPVNNNRNSANVSVNVLATIENASLVDANADTDVSGATLIASGSLGSRQSGGVVLQDEEIVLKQNTVYCMRAVAVAAGWISFNAKWYEHTDKSNG